MRLWDGIEQQLLLIMDRYLLARVMRSFNGEETNRVVIYVGTTHATQYAEWFTQLGFRLVHEVLRDGERGRDEACVPLAPFRSPSCGCWNSKRLGCSAVF